MFGSFISDIILCQQLFSLTEFMSSNCLLFCKWINAPLHRQYPGACSWRFPSTRSSPWVREPPSSAILHPGSRSSSTTTCPYLAAHWSRRAPTLPRCWSGTPAVETPSVSSRQCGKVRAPEVPSERASYDYRSCRLQTPASSGKAIQRSPLTQLLAIWSQSLA